MSVNLLIIFFVLVVIAMIAFILVQKGAGATAGSAFGSGASATVFGAKGSGNFLTKTTMLLAFLFFAISMYMAVQASKEFAPASEGKVDLGVFGEVDTSTSDVPQVQAAKNDKAVNDENSDVPTVTTEKKNAAESDVPTATTQVEDAIKTVTDTSVDKAEELKQAATDKVNEVKQVADDKLGAIKDKALDKVEEEVKQVKEQVKDKIDG